MRFSMGTPPLSYTLNFSNRKVNISSQKDKKNLDISRSSAIIETELHKSKRYGGGFMRGWLKDVRTEKRMTMKEVSQKLGISESYYCAIERGKRQKNMDMSLVYGLASVFGMRIADIVELEQRERG